MERHPDSASSPGFRADPSPAQTAPARTWLHRLVNVVVAIVVLAVAAGMFVFSYPGVHAIARQGGVSGLLAFSLFLTMLRQSRPQPADAAPGQAPARGPAGDGAAEQPTAPMMISNVDIVPTLAAGAAAGPPPAPPALPAAPASASPAGASPASASPAG